ncbi:SDR family NAD(P)-dependent oxidoreductase [Tumebacillus permanentifrigoris]|uniref:3-oxoacyl-[acyl-carrier protein] reductase n=1 Tax=Tumebacillus permanentifrigoris TaxID=378543 RepID=A0A316DHV5_9BACL|nr:SDR family NAD(P)-dependent oxidoreductase [Tumebacillus permanentifrigoris]PWK16193.1 3-oxoacyl-[acyl-carrier protein] reductase [Tumebacillus permanentifrigoris]
MREPETNPRTTASSSLEPSCTAQLRTRRVALITGASGAIGAAIAEQLARRGDDVWLAYHRNGEKAERLAQHLQATYETSATALPLNLLDRPAMHQALARILTAHGRLDILIHCAGVTRDKLLIQTGASDFDDSLELHVTALYRLLQACLPSMRAHHYGRIVALTSYAALHGRTGQSAYAASKAALIGLVKAAALEEIAHGITVNAVAPSVTASAMTDALTDSEQARLLHQIPLGRMQTPAEAAALVEWLTSEPAGTVSGQVLAADNRTHRW